MQRRRVRLKRIDRTATICQIYIRIVRRMAIVRCPSCDQRISSLVNTCPRCHEVLAELSDDQRDRIALRRWRDRIYRARNFSYLAMTLVVVGMIAWWIGEPQGLALPVPGPAAMLLGLGMATYLLSWAWLLWLRWFQDPRKRPD
jgi:hypothetical protein